MPPARTIIVDTDRMLTTIAAIAIRQHAAVVANRKAAPGLYYEGRLESELADAEWRRATSRLSPAGRSPRANESDTSRPCGSSKPTGSWCSTRDR